MMLEILFRPMVGVFMSQVGVDLLLTANAMDVFGLATGIFGSQATGKPNGFAHRTFRGLPGFITGKGVTSSIGLVATGELLGFFIMSPA